MTYMQVFTFTLFCFPIKVLCEFVFSSGKTKDSFSLYTSPPKHQLPLSETCTLQDCGLTVPSVIIVEKNGHCDNVTEILFPLADLSVCINTY